MLSDTKFYFKKVTPLPSFQGIQLSNSKISSTDPVNSNQAISLAEKKKYQSIYQSQNPTANGILAANAKALFARSRLPKTQLAQIW